MKKTYDPHDIERPLYEWWEKQGYFKPNGNEYRGSFCIMLPPPNITGSLHMGHAFQHAVMDILIRYQRMLGKNVLWQVGTDHAGIATQMLVERKIAAEKGKTRFDYDRSEFIDEIWKWKKKFNDRISFQMRRLGSSVDWERERFSMDDGFSYAVKEAFVRLYRENLIYRAKRLVNWDPKLQTAISDLEVVNRESRGFIWYVRYPLADGGKTKDGKNYLVLATTRPETLFGDTGVAVNPTDPRYRCLIGKFVILPLVNRRIPIVGDRNISVKKGTGCMKITPAHDFFDNEIAHRHQLPMINILTFNGNIRESAEVFDFKGNKSNSYSTEIPIRFQKLNRFVARKEVVSTLDALNLLEKTKFHCLALPYGERSGEIIEPMLVNQWYLRVNKMAKTAIRAVENGDIKFIPSQYKNMYFSWMNNIQDWCISRQLLWGHRIPAWYEEQGNIYVGYNEEEVRQRNNLSKDVILHQEEDVLDTWFSSSLWTFSSLGWPKRTSALRQFHPTSVIVSGFDIIFFWIARMIMMTMHFIKDNDGNSQVPFKIVYVTGLVCDEEGQKMSKSKGNVIDPMDVIDGISLTKLLEKRTKNMLQPQLESKIRRYTKKYFPKGIYSFGTDALRLTLTALASTSRDICWNMKSLEGYRNFCNKLWNASRFVLMNTENKNCGFNKDRKILSLVDNWILDKFNRTVKIYRKALDTFRFDIAVEILYEFTWNQFCNWYLELIKPMIRKGSEVELLGTRYTLVTVLESLLRLAHPIIPFITEFIWQRVKIIAGINESTIMLQPFPKFEESLISEEAFFEIEWIKKIIVAIRHVRTEMNIESNKLIRVIFRNCEDVIVRRVNKNKHLLQDVARIENISLLSEDNGNGLPISITKIIDGVELLIPIEGLINKKIELERLKREIEKIEKKICKIKEKLENNSFIAYAPKSKVIFERNKLMTYLEEKSKLIEQKSVVSAL